MYGLCFLVSLFSSVAFFSVTTGVELMLCIYAISLPPSKIVMKSTRIFGSFSESMAFVKLLLYSFACRALFFSVFLFA
ncbi:unnamed protein product, partial [Soboliphyme baturini]|uniref:Secreted peptide n=1 Tax=Soboliphyme baturini TaxID=241478 RepID=A0A183IAM6_9BILA